MNFSNLPTFQTDKYQINDHMSSKANKASRRSKITGREQCHTCYECSIAHGRLGLGTTLGKVV